jgi:hypothetical protein
VPGPDLDDVVPEAAAAPKEPVKTWELASDGYHRTLAAHRQAAPPRLADPDIAKAVERQTRAMRELRRRTFPEAEVPSDDQPAPIEAARVQRRRESEATRTLALRRARAECRPAGRHASRRCRSCPAAYNGLSTSIVCEANAVEGTMSWDERWGFVRGDRRQIQTAVLGGADSDEPLMLLLEAIELDAFRRRQEHDTFWCGLLLGGCGLQLTTKQYTDRVCSLSSSAC